MPVRLPPVTDRAQRLLFEGIVDYAGLFPPASVSMKTAVRNYANYRGGGAAWMLGRFVCPANALDEFSAQAEVLLPRDAGAIPWRLSAIGSADAAADIAAIAAFNERHRVCFDEVGAVVDSYETRVTSVEEIASISARLPRELTTYFEFPLAPDPKTYATAIARVNRCAKLRLGGLTPEAFPSSSDVIRAMAACIAAGVPTKATAGLHHPICGDYKLTYDEASPVGPMYGFVNVFLAAAYLAAGGLHDEAQRLLLEQNALTLEINDHSIAWRGAHGTHHFDRELLQRVRERVMTSFGSCSFNEPVDESRRLGLA